MEPLSLETGPFSVHRKKCPREARITGCSLHHLWREIRYSQFRLRPLRPDVARQQARTATNFQYTGDQWKPPLCSEFRQRLSGNALYPGAVLIAEGRGTKGLPDPVRPLLHHHHFHAADRMILPERRIAVFPLQRRQITLPASNARLLSLPYA